MNEDRATIDFETRSALDIKKHGAWKYSRHFSTEVLCLAFRLPGDTQASLWHAGYMSAKGWVEAGMLPGHQSTLADLFCYIATGGLVEAHNSGFEEYIWDNIFSKKPQTDALGITSYRKGVGAPSIRFEQWRCSASKAAAFSLPRKLADATAALFGVTLKDDAGHRIMLKLSKPRKARKKETSWATYYHDAEADYLHLFSYCKQDVDAEHALSEGLPDLSPAEYKIWCVDRAANRRGVRIDVELCRKAIEIKQQAEAELNGELYRITGIALGSARAQVLAWIRAQGVEIADTTKETVEWFLGDDGPEISDRVRRVLEIVRDVNRTSTAKFQAMLNFADDDDQRVRDLVMYWGATTGRFTGKGIQVHNYPRGNLKAYKLDMDEARNLLRNSSYEELKTFIAQAQAKNPKAKLDVLDFLVSVLRGMLIPSEGYEFISADYAAIEARVALWFAGEQEALDVFAADGDLYCEMASLIYQREITRKQEKERKFGKEAILSLGFGVGFLTFAFKVREQLRFTHEEVVRIVGSSYDKYTSKLERALNPQLEHFLRAWEKAKPEAVKHAEMLVRMAKLRARMIAKRCTENHTTVADMTPEFILCMYVVDLYRSKYAEVPKLWEAIEEAALSSVRNPGVPYVACKCTFTTSSDRKLLTIMLPSGRPLIYNSPSIEAIRTPWGELKEQVTFMGVAKKGAKKWVKNHSYGASFFENIVQATARDQMCYAMSRGDEIPELRLVMTIHDEELNEQPKGLLTVEQFERFMAKPLPCLAGCPIKAEGGIMQSFRK